MGSATAKIRKSPEACLEGLKLEIEDGQGKVLAGPFAYVQGKPFKLKARSQRYRDSSPKRKFRGW